MGLRSKKNKKDIKGVVGMIIATGCFVGLLPRIIGKRGKGGGTAGSLLVTLILISLYNQQLSKAFIFNLALLTLLIGWWAVKHGERFMLACWGESKRHTGDLVDHDFNETCVDEMHGMLLAVLPIYLEPLPFWHFLILHVLAFALFRFFDGVKPWPISIVEDSEEDIGKNLTVMLDDSAAGFATMLFMLMITMVVIFCI